MPTPLERASDLYRTSPGFHAVVSRMAYWLSAGIIRSEDLYLAVQVAQLQDATARVRRQMEEPCASESVSTSP